jgi:predicted O-methyltransferase YrrM
LADESAYTRPHPSCLHPERWHAPDGESTEAEVSALVGALVVALQPEFVVETGSAFGYTTEQIGRALASNGHGSCVSLEIDRGRAQLARERCDGLPVEVVVGSSLDYVPTREIDLLFSDSDYSIRRAEVERFLGWMRRGSIVAVHDTTSAERGHHVDMRREVERLQRANLLRCVYLPTPRGLALCSVVGADN